MSRATPDDQLKFLLNCVKHSNNGKVELFKGHLRDCKTDRQQIDFVEVAKECGIVSKGAAYVLFPLFLPSKLFSDTCFSSRAKRYERLMKANGIHPNGGPDTRLPVASPPATGKPSSKAAIAKAAAAKKRKIEGDNPAVRMKHDEEDDKELVKPKVEREAKMEPADHVLVTRVKAEPFVRPSLSVPPTSYASSSSPAAVVEHMPQPEQLYGETSIFDEFCVPEMFAQYTFVPEEVKMEEVPRYMPPPPAAVVERSRQVGNADGGSGGGSGKGPSESIVIAD